MYPKLTAILLGGSIWAASAAAQAPPSGAKELFYDPVGATATRVSQGASPSSPPARSPAPPQAVQQAQPARGGAYGRRSPVAATQATRTSPQNLGLSYWIEKVGPEGGPSSQVTERHTFRSGDRIRIHFQSNADGDIALFQIGSSGTGQLLFPDLSAGLTDSRLSAGEDKVLPHDTAWFRFDEQPGTEQLIVFFARSAAELQVPARPTLNEEATKDLIRNARHLQGSKDLVIATEAQTVGEVGTYGVNKAGKPIVLEIKLEHR